MPLILVSALAACSGSSTPLVRTGPPPTSARAACVRLNKDLSAIDKQSTSIGVFDATKREAAHRQTDGDLRWDVSGLPSGNVVRRDVDKLAAIVDRLAVENEKGVSNPLDDQLDRHLHHLFIAIDAGCTPRPGISEGTGIVKCGVDPDGHPLAVVTSGAETEHPFYGHLYAGFRLGNDRRWHRITRRVHYAAVKGQPDLVRVSATFTWRAITTHRKVRCTFGDQ
jgi:hypothetical protein